MQLPPAGVGHGPGHRRREQGMAEPNASLLGSSPDRRVAPTARRQSPRAHSWYRSQRRNASAVTAVPSLRGTRRSARAPLPYSWRSACRVAPDPTPVTGTKTPLVVDGSMACVAVATSSGDVGAYIASSNVVEVGC